MSDDKMTGKAVSIPITTMRALGELREMQLKSEHGRGQKRLDAMQRVAEAELRRTGNARLDKLGIRLYYWAKAGARGAELAKARRGQPDEQIMRLNSLLVRDWLIREGLYDDRSLARAMMMREVQPDEKG